MLNPTKRFSSRAENYQKYRPGYPVEILEVLHKKCGLTSTSILADIGSGTGILTRIFLENENIVYGIEPNKEMREAGELFLKDFPKFTSISASAEDSSLPSESVDFVVAGQAFHWFQPLQAKAEFSRILRPGGWVVLLWNERPTDTTRFLQDYESLLLKYCDEYRERDLRTVNDEKIRNFFSPGEFCSKHFDYYQHLDYAGLKGRLLSSSYAPQKSHPDFQDMIDELYVLFGQHQKNQKVVMEYVTKVYYGRIS